MSGSYFQMVMLAHTDAQTALLYQIAQALCDQPGKSAETRNGPGQVMHVLRKELHRAEMNSNTD